MKGDILMSVKEVDRIPTVEKLVNGLITVTQAAERLSLSTRQVKRIKKRFLKEGAKGLIHKGRGRTSSRAIQKEEIKRIMKIVKDEYHDFGPTLALEKLKEYHGSEIVSIGRERLRLAMISEGIWKPRKRRKVKVFQMRERRAREGELVQADGSPYAWFEDRGPYCNLLVFIDDATGKLKHLQFVLEETTNDYFKAMDAYIKAYGKPLSLYVDKHSVFRTTRYTGGSGVDDSLKETQFTRAMRQLSIEVICAHSPQAKGRVENVNGTLQDRLVKEMRLKGISTMEEGNKFLPEFIKTFNAKFAVKPKDKNNAHRTLLPSEDLKDILVKRQARVLSKNLTFQYKGKLYQVNCEKAPYSMRHLAIEVREDWNEKVSAYYKGKKLNIRVIKRCPKTKVVNGKELTNEIDRLSMGKPLQTNWKPAKDHPWRRFVYR